MMTMQVSLVQQRNTLQGDVKVLINTKLILARYYKVKGMESCKMQILS